MEQKILVERRCPPADHHPFFAQWLLGKDPASPCDTKFSNTKFNKQVQKMVGNVKKQETKFK